MVFWKVVSPALAEAAGLFFVRFPLESATSSSTPDNSPSPLDSSSGSSSSSSFRTKRFHLMFGIFLWFLTFLLLLFLSLILLLRFFGFGVISLLSILRCFFLFFGLLLQRRRVVGRSRNPWRQPVHRGTSAIFNSVWFFRIIVTHVQWWHHFTGEKPTELLEIATGGAAAAAGAGLLLDKGCRLRLASSRSNDAKSNA